MKSQTTRLMIALSTGQIIRIKVRLIAITVVHKWEGCLQTIVPLFLKRYQMYMDTLTMHNEIYSIVHAQAFTMNSSVLPNLDNF